MSSLRGTATATLSSLTALSLSVTLHSFHMLSTRTPVKHFLTALFESFSGSWATLNWRGSSHGTCTLTPCGVYFRLQLGWSTTKCNMHCPHSSINQDLKHWKTKKYFPSSVPGRNPQNPLGKGALSSAPTPRLCLVRNCSHALLRWACPKRECNESKASCFTP